MILPSLAGYYRRLRDNPDVEMPAFGFARQNISFALELDLNGLLVTVHDIRRTSKGKPVPRRMILPTGLEERAGAKIAPHFMWDNTMYVLGRDEKSKPKRMADAFEAFKSFHHAIGGGLDDVWMQALLCFLDAWNPDDARKLPFWEEMAGTFIVFSHDGTMHFLHEREAIKSAWLTYVSENSSDVTGQCLVSGETELLARIHPAIKGVRNAQTKGASIVSFNLNAFESYGKTQSYNAPVGVETAFAYTTALNHLLRSDSTQKVQVGDATTVFWTEWKSPVEVFMGMILDPRGDTGESQELSLFLEAVRDGKKPAGIDDTSMKFYILGLSPNAARLSVRFWHVSTVGDIAEKIGRHFNDLRIERRSDRDPEFPGMWQLIRETANRKTGGTTGDPNPLLAGALMRSILTGAAYPTALMTSIISRIRADKNISYLRAAIVKACLQRKRRLAHTVATEVTVTLDKDSMNIGYRLGRLFAALEKAQRDAIPGANTTIKDRYFGAASATPRAVFPRLMSLAQHHIQKAEYGHRTDRIIEEIMQDIHEFPAHLSLDDQGMFVLGYYHQRPAMYEKTKDVSEEN